MSYVLAFVVVALVVNLTPGPAMLHCITSGASGGVRAGLAAAAGVELGVFVYIVATVTGLSALLVAAPPVYLGIQIVGIAFLLYLAWTAVPRRGTDEQSVADANATGKRPRVAFVQGFFINVSNPKIALFFLTLLPQFVPSGASSWQLLAYGVAFNLSGLLVNASAGVIGNKVVPATKRLGRARALLPWIPPIVFAGLAVVSVRSLVSSV